MAPDLELLAKLSAHPDLVIIDLEMQVMDGISLIQKLAEQNQFIVILISSSREPILLSSVKTKIKACGFLVVDSPLKPLKIDALKEAFSRYEKTQPQVPTHHQPKTVVQATDIIAAITGQQFIPFFQPKIRQSNAKFLTPASLYR